MYKSKGLPTFFMVVSLFCMDVGITLLLEEMWVVGALLLAAGAVGLFLCLRANWKITLHNKLVWEKKEEEIMRHICTGERVKKAIREEALRKKVDALVVEELLKRGFLPPELPQKSLSDEEGSALTGSTSSAKPGYIYCPACQAEQLQNLEFCSHCGALLRRR